MTSDSSGALRSHYLPDQWTLTDGLHFDDFLAALVDVVLYADTPMTLGVHGAWGSGKTSLLQMLRRAAETDGGDLVKTAWFTAWKYDRHEDIWRALILRVIDSLSSHESGDASSDAGSNDGNGLQERLERLAQSLYSDVEWQERGEWSISVGEGLKLPLALGARLAGVADIAKELGLDPKVTNIVRRKFTEHRLEQVTTTERFESLFEEVVEFALGPEGRLVVFVDDLDRCLPEHTVSVLEAVKLFVNVPGTVFVLGMDREVVKRAVETHYGSVLRQDTALDSAPLTGDQYLQKIVQLPFYLPPLDEDSVLRFIEGLEAGRPPDIAVDDLTRRVIAKAVFGNPRQVKLCLNVFHLLRRTATAAEDRGGIPREAIAWPLLAKTVLIQSQWPNLYEIWRRYPTIVQTLEREYVARRDATPAPAVESADTTPNVPSRGPGSPYNGLLDEYLTNEAQYRQLAELLTFPPYVGEGRSRARFSGLTRSELRCYLGLTGDVTTGAPDSPRRLLDEMLSGDVARLEEAAAQVAERDDSEGIRAALAADLLGILRAPSQPASTRASAGTALDVVGDPRFDPDSWQLPREELWGFVEIPAGKFLMGSVPAQDGHATEVEQSQHEVSVDEFLIGRYPVTRAQFAAFVSSAGFAVSDEQCFAGRGNHPITRINWDETEAYCRWLDKRLRESHHTPAELKQRLLNQGWKVRLPSEAEWEKAARGTDGRIYPWGNAFDADRTNCAETMLHEPSTVGCFPSGASPYGVEDMSGNVWEWTASRFRGYPDGASAPADTDHQGSPNVAGDFRVGRGGSFDRERGMVRAASRVKDAPGDTFPYYGFRVSIGRELPIA